MEAEDYANAEGSTGPESALRIRNTDSISQSEMLSRLINRLPRSSSRLLLRGQCNSGKSEASGSAESWGGIDL
jgi:hypothetical protein